MIALDTNILVRYLTQDDPVQSAQATSLIENELSESEPGYISLPVLCELLWTLRSTYRLGRRRLMEIVATLLDTAHFVVDEPGLVEEALNLESAELTDAIIHALGRSRGCVRTVTFDRDFSRLEGVDLIA